MDLDFDWSDIDPFPPIFIAFIPELEKSHVAQLRIARRLERGFEIQIQILFVLIHGAPLLANQANRLHVPQMQYQLLVDEVRSEFSSRGAELSISDAATDEGNSGSTALQFTVSLSAARSVPVTVNVTASDGSAAAGSDFTPFPPTLLTFAPGETSKLVTIDVIGDGQFELDETFSVTLAGATGAFIADSSGTGTIRNDDASPMLNVSNPSVAEGDAGVTTITFTVSLSSVSAFPAVVNYASADGTALAGSDYTAIAPGTLTFAPGETSKTITVDVLGDTSIEDHETLSVVLSEAQQQRER